MYAGNSCIDDVHIVYTGGEYAARAHRQNGVPSLFDMPKCRLDYLTITFTALPASFTM